MLQNQLPRDSTTDEHSLDVYVQIDRAPSFGTQVIVYRNGQYLGQAEQVEEGGMLYKFTDTDVPDGQWSYYAQVSLNGYFGPQSAHYDLEVVPASENILLEDETDLLLEDGTPFLLES